MAAIKKFITRRYLVDTLYYTVGSIFCSLALYTFALNANFAPGGVSGISIIINHFTGWPIGTLALVLNIPLVIVCYAFIGHRFLLKSLWTMIIFTFFTDVVFPMFPTYSGNSLLAAIFFGLSMGAGLTLIYMRGSSTGGTDFITMTIKKLRPHFSMGQVVLAVDLVVILAGGIAFRNVDSVLYGVVASFTCTITIDRLLYGVGSSKLAIIITNHGREIADAISAEIYRGATLVPAVGSYTGQQRDMLLCVCSKSQIYRVRAIAKAIDQNSMIIITDASEVIGEGFRPTPIPGNEIPTIRTGKDKQ